MTSASKTVSNTFPKTLSTNKRARSQDSKRSLNVSPVQKAAKVKGSVGAIGHWSDAGNTSVLTPDFRRYVIPNQVLSTLQLQMSQAYF